MRASVQFSRWVVSNSLRRHESQHASPPCPSPTSGVHPNPCPSSRWCRPMISSCVIPFSSCPQSIPAPGSFQMSHLFASGGQSIRVSASTSVLPMNTQDWFPLGLTGWISLQATVSPYNLILFQLCSIYLFGHLLFMAWYWFLFYSSSIKFSFQINVLKQKVPHIKC